MQFREAFPRDQVAALFAAAKNDLQRADTLLSGINVSASSAAAAGRSDATRTHEPRPARAASSFADASGTSSEMVSFLDGPFNVGGPSTRGGPSSVGTDVGAVTTPLATSTQEQLLAITVLESVAERMADLFRPAITPPQTVSVAHNSAAGSVQSEEDPSLHCFVSNTYQALANSEQKRILKQQKQRQQHHNSNGADVMLTTASEGVDDGTAPAALARHLVWDATRSEGPHSAGDAHATGVPLKEKKAVGVPTTAAYKYTSGLVRALDTPLLREKRSPSLLRDVLVGGAIAALQAGADMSDGLHRHNDHQQQPPPLSKGTPLGESDCNRSVDAGCGIASTIMLLDHLRKQRELLSGNTSGIGRVVGSLWLRLAAAIFRGVFAVDTYVAALKVVLARRLLVSLESSPPAGLGSVEIAHFYAEGVPAAVSQMLEAPSCARALQDLYGACATSTAPPTGRGGERGGLALVFHPALYYTCMDSFFWEWFQASVPKATAQLATGANTTLMEGWEWCESLRSLEHLHPLLLNLLLTDGSGRSVPTGDGPSTAATPGSGSGSSGSIYRDRVIEPLLFAAPDVLDWLMTPSDDIATTSSRSSLTTSGRKQQDCALFVRVFAKVLTSLYVTEEEDPTNTSDRRHRPTSSTQHALSSAAVAARLLRDELVGPFLSMLKASTAKATTRMRRFGLGQIVSHRVAAAGGSTGDSSSVGGDGDCMKRPRSVASSGVNGSNASLCSFVSVRLVALLYRPLKAVLEACDGCDGEHDDSGGRFSVFMRETVCTMLYTVLFAADGLSEVEMECVLALQGCDTGKSSSRPTNPSATAGTDARQADNSKSEGTGSPTTSGSVVEKVTRADLFAAIRKVLRPAAIAATTCSGASLEYDAGDDEAARLLALSGGAAWTVPALLDVCGAVGIGATKIGKRLAEDGGHQLVRLQMDHCDRAGTAELQNGEGPSVQTGTARVYFQVYVDQGLLYAREAPEAASGSALANSSISTSTSTRAAVAGGSGLVVGAARPMPPRPSALSGPSRGRAVVVKMTPIGGGASQQTTKMTTTTSSNGNGASGTSGDFSLVADVEAFFVSGRILK